MMKINAEIDVDVDDEEFLTKFHEALSGNDNLATLANLFDDILGENIACDDIVLQQHVLDMSSKLKTFEELH